VRRDLLFLLIFFFAIIRPFCHSDEAWYLFQPLQRHHMISLIQSRNKRVCCTLNPDMMRAQIANCWHPPARNAMIQVIAAVTRRNLMAPRRFPPELFIHRMNFSVGPAVRAKAARKLSGQRLDHKS